MSSIISSTEVSRWEEIPRPLGNLATLPPTRHCVEVPRVVDVIVGLRRRHAGAHGSDINDWDVMVPGEGGGRSAATCWYSLWSTS